MSALLSWWPSMRLVVLHLVLTSAQVGTGTTFWAAGDAGNPDPHTACWRRHPDVPEVLIDRAVAVAHRNLPCGSWVFLVDLRTLRGVRAQVWDRGPAHALVDLTRGTARRLRLDGMGLVLLVPFR